MTINTMVEIDPEEITSLSEVDEVLAQISDYEQQKDCKAGVILIQRRQFGGLYRIVSEEEAQKYLTKPVLSKPRTPEWGVQFWPRAYFEKRKEELQSRTPEDKSL